MEREEGKEEDGNKNRRRENECLRKIKIGRKSKEETQNKKNKDDNEEAKNKME